MKKAIVTGGAGFIGSNLVDELINQNIQVSIIDDLSTGHKENLNPKATFYNVDISKADPLRLQTIMEGADIVFHLAALARVQPSIEDPIPFNEVFLYGFDSFDFKYDTQHYFEDENAEYGKNKYKLNKTSDHTPNKEKEYINNMLKNNKLKRLI